MPVDGKVYVNGQKTSGAVITLFKNGQQLQQVVTTSNGKFSFELPPNAEYIIAITKPGYIVKKFKIVTANVPPDRAKGGNFNPFEPDVTLFEMPSAAEVSKRIEAILSQPIAIYQYVPSENNFNYDEKYTQAMQDKLTELEQLQKKAEKESEEKAKNAAMEAQQQLEIDNKYKAAVAKADKSFNSQDYATAKAGYNEALGIKPSEAYPKQKLAEIQKLLANANAQKDADAKYQAAIKKGDNAFNIKDYVTAKAGYNEASGIKPSEAYPKQKLADIDKLLADAQKQKDIDAKYQASITKGDNAFNTKDYVSAKAAYTDASGIKPDEKYPKQKLADIDKLLSAADAQKQKEQQYKDAIAKGDASFSSKDYSGAKNYYTTASGIKPDEQYPKNKLSEIDKLLSEMAKANELDKKYKDLISKGDNFFAQKNYTSARSSYSDASALKSAEQYPKTKIAEIDKILAAIASQKSAAEKDQQYNDAIAKADKYFNGKDYVDAKSSYNDALGIKPSEQYPKTKIAQIDKILADLDAQKSAVAKQKDIDDKYNAAIGKADAAFLAKDYSSAKISYTDASGIKPAEQYPKQRLAEIDSQLKKLSTLELEKKYSDALAKGDKAFSAKDYSNAKSAFQDASGLKPAEQYPKNRIAEIDKIMKDLAAKQSSDQEINNNYLASVTRGDMAFKENSFANAKVAYNEALTYKPNESYPKQKLAEIDKIEKARGQAQQDKELQVKYNSAIERADKAFEQKDYMKAKPDYEEALSYKPNEKYPKDRLKQIEELVKSSSQVIAKKNDVPSNPEEDKQKQYVNELRAKYPPGVTEEEITDGNKVILRRVVIRDDYAGVYTKVTHNWGGVYFFKDGAPITEVMFENESK